MLMVALLAFLLSPFPDSGTVTPHLQRNDQQRAYDARHDGRALPFPELRSRAQQAAPDARYLGPDFDPDSGIYTFKFMRDGQVIWVRVDSRTGRIIDRRGGR
jgi:uncharacterized membrane protein YkoI